MPYSMISMLFLKQLLMLVWVRDDDFDDDTFVLLVVSNRKFQQFQSNNTKRKEYVLRLQRTSPSQFWAIDSRSVLFQGVVLRVVLSSILLDFFKGKVDKILQRDTLVLRTATTLIL